MQSIRLTFDLHLLRMLSKLLFGKLYSADFAVGYQPDINPFTEQPVQAWNLPDIVSLVVILSCLQDS